MTIVRKMLTSTASAVALLVAAAPAYAQDTGDDQPPAEEPTSGPIEALEPAATGDETILVTGSRIRRSSTETAAPVLAIDQQSLTDRGFVSASEAVNQVTSNIPQLALSTGAGEASGSGQQYPNLFGLGAGRTLTLVNGRRFVTSSAAFGSASAGDAQVDANIIPTGLIQRIEIVQAGGAVVYGSDAIAGVVNYILRDSFEGIELDGQAGISTFGDYPLYSARLTAGHNFAGDRGNVAVNVEWSQQDLLNYSDRPLSNLSRITTTVAGVPTEVLDARFPYFNANGVIFGIPAPIAPGFLRNAAGQALQFGQNGELVPYDPGTLLSIPFGRGGQGYRFADLSNLRSGVERLTANLLARFDINDSLTLRGEFLYAKTEGVDQPQFAFRTVLGGANTGSEVIPFTNTNGFLTPATVAAITAVRPSFGAGAPLFLSKAFPDLLLDNFRRFDTETYRGLVALEGEFGIGSREFYWSISGSYGRVQGSQSGYGVRTIQFNNAINSVRLANGNVVCAINADAVTTNDDPACAPINPFGFGNVSQAARDYVNVPLGNDFRNEQIGLLATLGGELIDLPAGALRFSVAAEYRDEEASFTPFAANQQGLTGTGSRTLPAGGQYNTKELSGELLVPIVGDDFTLPLVNRLEASLAGRYVSNSLAGEEQLWSAGGQWEVTEGVTLRISRSRNFRAPTITQLFFPQTTTVTQAGQDPCDRDRINTGPNPAVRRANCLALFQANPTFGVGGTEGTAPGASAEARLAAFNSPFENFQGASITSGGNPNLLNEISNTLTFGIVLQPSFIPGLTITADRIEVDLTNGLVGFTNENFQALCYDNTNPPPGACEAFTRSVTPTATVVGGTVITGTSTTFNAGLEQFRGEVYNINYLVPLESIFSGNPGRLELALELTHTELRTRTRTVAGATIERFDNTPSQPDWFGRFDVRYSKGPFRFTYQVVYRDAVLAGQNATTANSAFPFIDENYIHNASTQFDVGGLTLRFGILNLFNTEPSYPTLSYGDIIGRQYYVGARVRF